MNCGCWIISIGPGCTPWMIIAAISTAEGAEPGMPSARQGMMCPGIDDMSPVSAAIRPSIEPLPNFSFSLLIALAAAYDIHAPASSPTPGRRPVVTPITPERSTVRQYCATSLKRGSTESRSSIILRSTGSESVVSTSARPKAPTSAGMSAMPPANSSQPKVNRSYAYRPSCPICATKRPSSPISHPLSGSWPTIVPDMVTPNRASQKNSKAPNFNATSASNGVNAARQITPNNVLTNAPDVAMPIARTARSGHAHQEHFLEHQLCNHRRGDADDACLHQHARRQLTRLRVAADPLHDDDRAADEDRRRQPERNPMPDEDHAVARAQRDHDQDAAALLALVGGDWHGRLRQRAAFPAAHAQHAAEQHHRDAEQARQQPGNGVGIDVLRFQPIHADGRDKDGNAERHPSDRVRHVRARRHALVAMGLMRRRFGDGRSRLAHGRQRALRASECRPYRGSPWPCRLRTAPRR